MADSCILNEFQKLSVVYLEYKYFSFFRIVGERFVKPEKFAIIIAGHIEIAYQKCHPGNSPNSRSFLGEQRDYHYDQYNDCFYAHNLVLNVPCLDLSFLCFLNFLAV